MQKPRNGRSVPCSEIGHPNPIFEERREKKREEESFSSQNSLGCPISEQRLPSFGPEDRQRLRRLRVDGVQVGVDPDKVFALFDQLTDEVDQAALILDRRPDGWHLHGLVIVPPFDDEWSAGPVGFERAVEMFVGVPVRGRRFIGSVHGIASHQVKRSIAAIWNAARDFAQKSAKVYRAGTLGNVAHVLGGPRGVLVRSCPMCGKPAARITCSRLCAVAYQNAKRSTVRLSHRGEIVCACGCGTVLAATGRGRAPKYVNATHRMRDKRRAVSPGKKTDPAHGPSTTFVATEAKRTTLRAKAQRRRKVSGP